LYGRQERCLQGCGGGDLMEKDHSKDLDIDQRMILKWILRSGMGRHGLD
jgi:hypothetical protein